MAAYAKGGFVRPGGVQFSNESIVAPVKGKPHVCLRLGFWRVSPQEKPYSVTMLKWRKAYDFVQRLNGVAKVQRIIDAMTNDDKKRLRLT